MVRRSNLPERAVNGGGLRAFLDSRKGAARVLFVAARPGDEIIAAGGAMQDLRDARILHVTDGAPRDLNAAVEAGYLDRLDYAEAFRREFASAMEFAGLSGEPDQLGFSAGELSESLAPLTMRLAAAIRRTGVDVVITHPYLGIDSDQDAVAFAVQSACAVLQEEERTAPRRIEMAGGAGEDDGVFVANIQREARGAMVTHELDAERMRLKQCMVERMPLRLRRLKNFSLQRESFRAAPQYDFHEQAGSGNFDDGKSGVFLSGRRWRRMAAEALRVLGLAVG